MKIGFKNIAKISLVISIILFIVSLTQNAFDTSSYQNDMPGFMPLLFGGLGMAYGDFACFSWLANPFILVSWVYFRNVKKSLNFSFIALIFSSSFLLFKDVVTNEGGVPTEITYYDIGYWLWLSSMVIMFLGNVVQYYSNEHKKM